MSRRETPTPSSSRRETGPEHCHRTIGCMSGIFHFLSRHHNRSRKRLTSSKTEKTVLVVSSSKTSTPLEKPPPPHPSPPQPRPAEYDGEKTRQLRRRSSEDPRSPTIPAEIRRRSTESVDSPRQPPALVARLMGLEESAPTATAVTVRSHESAADKRRRLLGALEKCDEDLKTLKRIIDTVRQAEIKTVAVTSAVGPAVALTDGAKSRARAGQFELEGGDSKAEFSNGEQPSPVSVLDAISSPRYRSKRLDNVKPHGDGISAAGLKIVKPSRMGVLFTGEKCQKTKQDDRENYSGCLRETADVDNMWPPRARELTEIGKRLEETCQRRRQDMRSTASSAMVESVGEVWEDGVWEERWELGRVGVALAGDILWDLVEEIVSELMVCCFKSRVSLPVRRMCRKRLCF